MLKATTPLGTAYVTLVCKGADIPYPIERFQYTYSEEGCDMCTISINTKDKNAPDNPIFNDHTLWIATWGFVNGESKQRKIYLQDIKWSFTKSGRRATIEFADQAYVLKQNKSKQSYKGKTVLGIASEIAAKHGLNLKVSKPNPDGSQDIVYPWQIASTKPDTATTLSMDDFAKMQRASKAAADAVQREKEKKNKESFQQFVAGQNTGAVHNNPYIDLGISKIHNYIPQANKTPAQTLEELGNREPNGEVIIETRDSDIILKKRNFNKKPYRSYTYADDGEFFNFEPETKNKSKAGAALNSMFSSWDKANKEFSQGMTDLKNLLEHPEVAIAKYLRQSNFKPNMHILSMKKTQDEATLIALRNKIISAENDSLALEAVTEYQNQQEVIARDGDKYDEVTQKILDPNTPDQKAVGDWLIQRSTVGNYLPNGARIDNTGVVTQGLLPALAEEIRQAYVQTVGTLSNALHDPTADGETGSKDAYGNAKNSLDNSNLQVNPASGLFWGDVNHETGVILTLLAVAKKYSGNYYIIKSTHTLEHEGGYTTHDEFATQGTNLKVPNNNKAVKHANQAINAEVGRKGNNQSHRQIKTERNRR